MAYTEAKGSEGGSKLMPMCAEWENLTRIRTQEWRCGFCDREVASDVGWQGSTERAHGFHDELSVAICPRCTLPTFLLENDLQIPGPKFGEEIEHLPTDVEKLYSEARRAMGVSAYTSAVIAGRKLLMSIAVAQGAKAGESFKAYVDGFEASGLVTAGMKDWVDEIRELGNDANHEIALMSKEDAETLLNFVVMLLKIAYEFPEKGRHSVAARASR